MDATSCRKFLLNQGRVAGNQASAGLKAAAISGHAEVVEDLLSTPGSFGLIEEKSYKACFAVPPPN